MKILRRIIVSILPLIILTGCWNKFELPERAFVQAIAIDTGNSNKLLLTTLFYKPGGGGSLEGGPQLPAGFNIRTEGDSIFKAVRDINFHLGRLAQWSHMRIILIGEEVVRAMNVSDIIDFFIRDHEPRETVTVAITKGTAGDYFKIKPYVESTIGQQLHEMNTSSSRFTGESSEVDLLNAAIQLKSQTGIAIFPYVSKNEERKELSVTGLAILKNGKLVDIGLSANETLYLNMIRNVYDKGILEFPCPANGEGINSLENVNLDSSMRVKPAGETVKVRIQMKLEGNYGELRCLDVHSPQDEIAITDEIRKMLENKLKLVMTKLQSRGIDLLGIGDRIYRENPALWRKWKDSWDRRFAEAEFEYRFDIRIDNSGMLIPKPVAR